jgi:hypothetical protein
VAPEKEKEQKWWDTDYYYSWSNRSTRLMGKGGSRSPGNLTV